MDNIGTPTNAAEDILQESVSHSLQLNRPEIPMNVMSVASSTSSLLNSNPSLPASPGDPTTPVAAQNSVEPLPTEFSKPSETQVLDRKRLSTTRQRKQTVSATCALAKHRKAPTIEVRDVQFILERNWNMWVPGYGTEEVRPYKKSAMTEAHRSRMALIKKTLKKY
ncbi:TAF12 [Lepeophtheirus salmonis]|uniref:Transcription initiation factor TFIID subunit 12 n=1 Tax=Lepeophtheirus salmonis TaxID=72036 RepID=A0A7R8CJD6_LEPSM|nr:TAF12 [Lepeophtheirus salmonis]CAF2810252.1 TAF12 [Lepeophtheirus salmonis]